MVVTMVTEIQHKLNNEHFEAKQQIDRNGVPVGIVEGYIATFDRDRTLDKFDPNAFNESIKRYRRRKRNINLKDMHGRTIGQFPINQIKVDEKGLFGVGEINLELQQGQEAYSLARQGVYSNFSIGFRTLEAKFVQLGDNLGRDIDVAEIVEGSLVDDPANFDAEVTEVKKFTMDDVHEHKSLKDIEQTLSVAGFSEKASKTIISQIKQFSTADDGGEEKGSPTDDGKDTPNQSDSGLTAEHKSMLGTINNDLTDFISGLTNK